MFDQDGCRNGIGAGDRLPGELAILSGLPCPMINDGREGKDEEGKKGDRGTGLSLLRLGSLGMGIFCRKESVGESEMGSIRE